MDEDTDWIDSFTLGRRRIGMPRRKVNTETTPKKVSGSAVDVVRQEKKEAKELAEAMKKVSAQGKVYEDQNKLLNDFQKEVQGIYYTLNDAVSTLERENVDDIFHIGKSRNQLQKFMNNLNKLVNASSSQQ